jgi:GDP-4-dehydro-6-deoxy-D-mannose reductase
VAGATGLLGAPVATVLEDYGHEVHRLSRRLIPSDRSYRVDLRDRDAMDALIARVEPEAVVQMTGGTASDSTRMAESNIVPTVNLIDTLARSDRIPTLFITGSAAEYGDPGSKPASEDSELRPLSPYGWIKLSEVAAARSMAADRGVPLTVVRPFNPVSPQLPQSTALGNFRMQLLGDSGPRRHIVCGRIDVVRDFVTTNFIGSVIAELLESPPGGVVNICSGVGLSLEELMRASGVIAGVELTFDVDAELAGLPAPTQIVGDHRRLFSLVDARPETDPRVLGATLLGPDSPYLADLSRLETEADRIVEA